PISCLYAAFQGVVSSSQPCQRQPGSCSAETAAGRPREEEDARGRAAGNAQGRSVILSTPIYVGRTSNPRGPPDAYKMSANPRGKALVISNYDFGGLMNNRPGTDIDAVKIRDLFEKLHFSVDVEKDLTRQEMKLKLKEFARAPEHRQSDCCVVVIMSHGYQSPGEDPEGSWRPLGQQPGSTHRPCPYVVYSSDGRALEVEWIIQQFNIAEALKGKPKLFIIQACRGKGQQARGQSGNFVESDANRFGGASQDELNADDIFVANSTIPYYVSYRNSQEGTWFIQSICHVFAESAHSMDLQVLIRKVHDRLAMHEGPNGEKQSAELWVRGKTKALFFNPGFVDS
ncbi:unnamed protein product, partial [Darwinula stevensoni]